MNKNGFTLIEVLIVLAISGILLLGISEFFLASDKNIRREMLEKTVDERAFLALQMLGKDISKSAHILDAGKIGNSSANNIKAWLNLSPWVEGANLQIWHLNPNSDWLVLNSPKPIAKNHKKLAIKNPVKKLELRLDGSMASGAYGNSLECLFANSNKSTWLGADEADQVRIGYSGYYSFTNPVDANIYDSIQKQNFENFLTREFSLHFGVWKNKNATRVFPNNWRDTKNLILDKNASILPQYQGCFAIENPPLRLLHLEGSKTSNPKGEINVSAQVVKNSSGAYYFSQGTNSQPIIKDFYAKNTKKKTSYFAKDKNRSLVLTTTKTWRRINSSGALATKNANLDNAYTKIESQIIGDIKLNQAGRAKIETIIKVEEFQPLLRAQNSSVPSSFFLFYENTNIAKSYRNLISNQCAAAGWKMPEVVTYKNCSTANYGVAFYNANCKNWQNSANKKLPEQTPIFNAKIPLLHFNCASGFSKVTNSSGNQLLVKGEITTDFYRTKTNTSLDSTSAKKNIYYYRKYPLNSQNSTLFSRVNANLGKVNYFAYADKLEKDSGLNGCGIKKLRQVDFSSTKKIAYLPKFNAETLLKPEDFIRSTSAKYAYKDFFNCKGGRETQTSYKSSSTSAERTNSEWRFSLAPLNKSLTANLKFEPHLWYVQRPTKIDRDNSKTLIYSVAKCNHKRHCSFDNKNIRNQINGLNNMQIRFLNPLTQTWHNPVQMAAWLAANNQNWDKIKLVKLGLLVCSYHSFLPLGQTRTYRVLDKNIEDNSAYCKVVSGSFYLTNPGFNMR